MSDPVKRPYDSSRRQASAQATRAHVVEAATPLFVELGYEATSVRQLADAADVSVQTIYNTFGSKFGVFTAVVDVVVAGDHRPLAVADRDDMAGLGTLDDGRAVVEAVVRAALPVLSRLAPIYPTLRAAAGSDPEVAEAHRRFTIAARHDDLAPVVQRLADLGALAPHLDVARGTDVLWTVLSPDVYDLLVTTRGWTDDELGRWAIDVLAATLLAP